MPRKPKLRGKTKLKTHKATAKRFRLTGTGKLVRTKGNKSHLRRKRSARAKAKLARMLPVENRGLARTAKRLAPYMDKYKANPNAKSGGKSK